MSFLQKLVGRQAQGIVMTQQLQQSIKMLQLSNLDLLAYIEQELEKNPLLKKVSEDEQPSFDVSTVAEDGQQNDVKTRVNQDANVMNASGIDRAHMKHGPAGKSGHSHANEFDATVNITEDTSLHAHLTGQAALAFDNPVQRMIAQHLIDQIDDTGYLINDMTDPVICRESAGDLIESTLKTIQGFDPVGVGARTLSECLAIQLREKDRLDPVMQILIDHLDLLARHEFSTLKKLCAVDDEDLSDMISEIKSLDPKPGLKFSGGTVQSVIPDVFVRRETGGGWRVELNDETLPQILIDRAYYTTVAAGIHRNNEKKHLTSFLKNANWLIKSLDQRAQTILKVASEIVRLQDGFLNHGVDHLRPLNLKIIADAISMHESTVSRVVTNKFIATPRGIFSFKYFFTTAIAATNGGDTHSAAMVRQRIKNMTEQERPDHILSDDRIVTILRSQGIDIARRTVAKYRESLNIPSSVQRRRNKNSAKHMK